MARRLQIWPMKIFSLFFSVFIFLRACNYTNKVQSFGSHSALLTGSFDIKTVSTDYVPNDPNVPNVPNVPMALEHNCYCF